MSSIFWLVYTWEHLPYMEVLKSVHRTADGCSSIHTKNCGTKLPTVAVLWSFIQNCQRLQFYGPFWDPWGAIVTKLQTSAVLWTLLEQAKIWMLTKLQTVAVLWTLLGQVRNQANKTANGSSSMDPFGASERVCEQNCRPQQFYGHFWDITENCYQNCKRLQFYGHFWANWIICFSAFILVIDPSEVPSSAPYMTYW